MEAPVLPSFVTMQIITNYINTQRGVNQACCTCIQRTAVVTQTHSSCALLIMQQLS